MPPRGAAWTTSSSSSGDGDFLPALEVVKREGLTFALAHGPF